MTEIAKKIIANAKRDGYFNELRQILLSKNFKCRTQKSIINGKTNVNYRRRLKPRLYQPYQI